MWEWGLNYKKNEKKIHVFPFISIVRPLPEKKKIENCWVNWHENRVWLCLFEIWEVWERVVLYEKWRKIYDFIIECIRP
jgi:hypothetical protein